MEPCGKLKLREISPSMLNSSFNTPFSSPGVSPNNQASPSRLANKQDFSSTIHTGLEYTRLGSSRSTGFANDPYLRLRNSPLVLSELEVTFSSADALLVQNNDSPSPSNLETPLIFHDANLSNNLNLVSKTASRAALTEEFSNFENTSSYENQMEYNNNQLRYNQNSMIDSIYHFDPLQAKNLEGYATQQPVQDENYDYNNPTLNSFIYGYSTISKQPRIDKTQIQHAKFGNIFKVDDDGSIIADVDDNNDYQSRDVSGLNNEYPVKPAEIDNSHYSPSVLETTKSDTFAENMNTLFIPNNNTDKKAFAFSPMGSIVNFAINTCESAFEEGNEQLKSFHWSVDERDIADVSDNADLASNVVGNNSSIADGSEVDPKINAPRFRKRDMLKMLFFRDRASSSNE